MQILSHRGYWRDPSEKNSIEAFERSFRLGFGTETDFRDRQGRLVVAHDLPGAEALDAENFFHQMAAENAHLPLAVNIKADGLQQLLSKAFADYGVDNYFLFDMSIPDAIQSIKAGLRVFTRHSDVEPAPVLYAESSGVWVDAFFDDSWITPLAIRAHLDAGKQVCLVSPELHRRPHLPLWTRLREAGVAAWDGLLLCSDVPEEAVAFFEL